jgi:Tol biopolymer transport system component
MQPTAGHLVSLRLEPSLEWLRHTRRAGETTQWPLTWGTGWKRIGVAMRWSPLVAVAAGAAALAVPAGATDPGANGKLVFERPTRDGGNMFSVAPDGSSLTRLTNRKGIEGDSSWSPDGSKIAFACAKNPERGPYEICVINADGSGFTQLTRHRGFSVAPAWSPDGTKIVYATNEGGQRLRLYVMNADGSAQQRLTRNRKGTDYTDPQWSPDGATIAFAILKGATQETPRGFDSSIARIDADDGGNLRRLTPRRGPDELNPNWSPDGSSIAFEVSRLFDVRQSDLWLMSADGSGKRRLTRTRFYETNPVFSPDGTRIAFTGDRDNRNLSKRRRGRGFELYTMAVDGSDVFRVTDNRRADLFPDWQPLP